MIENIPIVVKKFGGTSVGSIELIKGIASKIASTHTQNEALVLVVSAMAKTTDDLLKLAYEVSDHPSKRELDMLLTAGERISMSLLALALHNEGLSSISFTGSQSGILTDAIHGNAHITKVKADRIEEAIHNGSIVIVAGFQGVSPAKEITTLGRGGSDTSAVALASFLNASRCEIYTDVAGVYTADPRIVSKAKLIQELDSELMLALAYSGSKVLHPRAVEFAIRFGITVEVKSSFTFNPGTMITNKHKYNGNVINMEEKKITALAHKDNLTCIILSIDQNLFPSIKDMTVDIFKYEASDKQLIIYVEQRFADDLLHFLQERKIEILSTNQGLAYVSLVGLGINLNMELVCDVMNLINAYHIHKINHSHASIDILINSTNLSDVLEIIHTNFLENE